MKAVVLLSGGMDSCTTAALAKRDGYNELIFVSARYGSKHQEAEMQAAEKVAEFYAALHILVDLPKVFAGAGSALMNESAMPKMTYQEIDKAMGPSPTVIPFRNANLLSAATSVAITHEAGMVYMGAHGEDARHWAYPDCTPEFLGAMANAIYIGSYMKVRMAFPLIWMSKAEVVMQAILNRAPLHLTWSCYSPVVRTIFGPDESHYVQCGVCPTCIERIHAFQENGIIDPVPYAIDVDWTDCAQWETTWS